MNGNPMQMLMQMLSSGVNPRQMVQNIMQNNPQMSAVLNQVKKSGMSMEQYARQYAKQNNINIDQMYNSLKQRGF